MLSVQGRVRAARVSDAERLEEVFCQSWWTAYRGIIPAQDLEMLVGKRQALWWKRALRASRTIVVVETSDVVAGYAMYGNGRGPFSDMGEIFELYISPEYQGHGLGELLFEGCRARLDERGLDGVVAWSLSENLPAIEFYRRRGGRVGNHRAERVGETTIPKVAIYWD